MEKAHIMTVAKLAFEHRRWAGIEPILIGAVAIGLILGSWKMGVVGLVVFSCVAEISRVVGMTVVTAIADMLEEIEAEE